MKKEPPQQKTRIIANACGNGMNPGHIFRQGNAQVPASNCCCTQEFSRIEIQAQVDVLRRARNVERMAGDIPPSALIEFRCQWPETNEAEEGSRWSEGDGRRSRASPSRQTRRATIEPSVTGHPCTELARFSSKETLIWSCCGLSASSNQLAPTQFRNTFGWCEAVFAGIAPELLEHGMRRDSPEQLARFAE